MNIKDLAIGASKIDKITGVIQSITPVRTVNLKTGGQAQVADAMLKDDTGTIKLNLWDAQIKMVKVGSIVEVQNGYITAFQGSLSLNIGRYGQLGVLQF